MLTAGIALGSVAEVLALNPVLVATVNPTNGYGALALSGRYLYSVGTSLSIFDISNPSDPVQVGMADIGRVGGSALAVSGNHAFVLVGTLANYYGANLAIFDVSNPTNPIPVGQINNNDWFGVGVSGQYVYLGGGSGPTGYFVQLYDISDPANPVSVSQIKSGVIDAVSSIAIRNNLAYTTGSGTWLLVSDISDPANPKTPQQNLQAAGFDLALSGPFAFVAEGETNYMTIWNVSNPTNCVLVPNHANAVGSSVVVWGDYAFTAGSMGLRITDISDPTNATLVFDGIAGGHILATYAQIHTIAVSKNYAYQGTAAGLLVYSLGISAPPLTMRTDSNTLLLSWPAPTGAFAVQESPDLNPADWTTLTNAAVVVASENRMTISKPAETMFYRLVCQ